MGRSKTMIIGGVDTHAATHHAAVIDSHGRLLADAEFPASPRGYAAMLTWMRSKGNLRRPRSDSTTTPTRSPAGGWGDRVAGQPDLLTAVPEHQIGAGKSYVLRRPAV
jgi:hypothetical protein